MNGKLLFEKIIFDIIVNWLGWGEGDFKIFYKKYFFEYFVFYFLKIKIFKVIFIGVKIILGFFYWVFVIIGSSIF